MPEVGFIVVSADARTEEFDFVRQGDRFKVGQFGDFAIVQIKAVEVSAIVSIGWEQQFLVVGRPAWIGQPLDSNEMDFSLWKQDWWSGNTVGVSLFLPKDYDA
ncbi:MAG: hypothetical protein AAF629_21215 [Chloroflexota bacterium]